MTKIKTITTALLLAGITGCSNVREIGCVNGTVLTRVTARGFFSPSSTTILAHTSEPGVEVLANATGPGFIPAIATAGGVAGGAALLRPARTSVNASHSSDNRPTATNVGNDVVQGDNNSTSSPGRSTPPSPPPGHVDNPSGNK